MPWVGGPTGHRTYLIDTRFVVIERTEEALMFWIVEQTDVEPTVKVSREGLPSNVIPFRPKTRPSPGPQIRWIGPFAADQMEGLLATQEAAIARLRHPSGRASTDEPAAT